MPVAVLGSINLDLSHRVAALPRPGETVRASSSERHAGGKGLNQAIAAARAGADVRITAAVGDDEAGRWLTGELVAAGVEVSGLVRIDGPTGGAQIVVGDSGENLIVVTPGANALLLPAHLQPPAGAGVRLAQLEVPVETIEAFFRQPGAAIRILNAAPAEPEGRRLLPLTDILIVNESELAAYAGLAADPDTPEAAAEAARALLSRPGQTVLVTLGKAGAIAVAETGTLAVAGRPTRAVDTTGAGDCFCGALAAARDEGQPMRQALRFANLAASLSVEKPGAAASMPSRVEIDAALQG
jgi:ribokinase